MILCTSLRQKPWEAMFKELGAGPLHDFLEKGVSEPSWVGQVENDTVLEVPQCQGDFLRTLVIAYR
jgi:hypothetical protein